jgi:carboxypeptidase D
VRSIVADEDQMAQDFLGFLSNLVLVFPSLAERPLYLTGESYAGVYIVRYLYISSYINNSMSASHISQKLFWPHGNLPSSLQHLSSATVL